MIVWLMEKLAILFVLFAIWNWFWALSLIPKIALGVALCIVLIYLFAKRDENFDPAQQAYFDECRRGLVYNNYDPDR